MNKLIILLGQRVRSGTNFVGSTISQHPNVVTLPQDITLGEFNLFSSEDIINQVYFKIAKSSFGMQLDNADKEIFLKKYGAMWLDLLKEKYAVEDQATIFVKSPSVTHYSLWEKAFPDAQIAIIYRDGRDNVISSIRASNDKRTWHNFSIKFKKKINYYSGRSFINHVKQWKKTAKEIIAIQESSRVKLFKYEELNDSKKNIVKLLSHYQLKVNDEIIEDCITAPVIGSSFGVSSNNMIKPNWKPETDKSKFKFSEKWKKWKLVKKMMFKYIAGKQLIDLGYEENNSW